MTQTAHVEAREAVYQILREAVRLGLELRPKTPRSRAALLHERIYESLIALRKVKELQRRRFALDTATPVRRARRRPPSGTGFHTRRVTFPRAPRARARRLRIARPRSRRLRIARPRCGVRMCADSGLSRPTMEGHFRMTNRRRTWETGFADIRGQGRAIQQQGHSASPRLPTDVQQDPGEYEQRALQCALAAPQGGVPTMALAQHCHQPWRHSGSDDHRFATPPSCFPRPCCGCARKETASARIAPVAVSVVFREVAALAVDLEPDHLPAGAAWPYESTYGSLATRLSCKRDERRVGRRQLEAVTDWSVESTKACAKPFAGSGERGPHTSKAKAASLLCANFQPRILAGQGIILPFGRRPFSVCAGS